MVLPLSPEDSHATRIRRPRARNRELEESRDGPQRSYRKIRARRGRGVPQEGAHAGHPVLRPPLRIHPCRPRGQTELPATAKAVGEPRSCAAPNKKIGVSVAYLKVPFYANFKTGLEDGAKQFGFTYDLVDGNSGDVATELANLQNFIAQKKDLILLTPSGDGIIPGIKLVNDAKIPLIEVNNKAGFGQQRGERAHLCRRGRRRVRPAPGQASRSGLRRQEGQGRLCHGHRRHFAANPARQGMGRVPR